MMLMRWIPIALAVWPLVARPSRGAPPAPPAPRAMAEDIEIMRQLLMKHLPGQANNSFWIDYGVPNKQGGFSGPPGGYGGLQGGFGGLQGGQGLSGGQYRNIYDPSFGARYFYSQLNTEYRAPTLSGTVEGTYLHGTGVVFQITLPSNQRAPVKQVVASPASVPTISEWERQRRKLRGLPPAPAAPPKPTAASAGATQLPAVTNSLLKLLAENGHNFRELGDNESLIVAVTFRDINGPSPSNLKRSEAPKQSPPAQQGNASEQKNQPSSVADLELLGDLHLKNGRFDEAIAAYRKAAEQPLDAQRHSAIYTKIAAAYQAKAGGNDEQLRQSAARALLSLADRQHAETAYGTLLSETAYGTLLSPYAAMSAQGQTPKLPAKLVLSARKRDLVAVAAGKMTFEQFRHAVSIAYHDYGAAEKK